MTKMKTLGFMTKMKTNLSLYSSTGCSTNYFSTISKGSNFTNSVVQNFNKLTTRTFSNLRRVTPFYSLIRLSFSHIVGTLGKKMFNIYTLVFTSVHQPSTNRNDLPINAAKILISFPLFWFTLSTNMVNKINSFNMDVSLPIYTWGLLDKFFVRVERENFGNEPGLHGSIISYEGIESFYEYINKLFTDEFLFECLTGTEFERLVTRHVDEQTNEYRYSVNIDFRNALSSRLRRFDCPVYSEQFLLEVSSFYSNFSSKFYNKMIIITKQPRDRTAFEAGLHVVRNHKFDDCFVYHKSVDGKFDNQFFFNSFVILSKLFNMTYFYLIENSDGSTSVSFYGNGETGNNEMYIDLSTIKLEDCLRTLFSAGIRTQQRNEDKRTSVAPQNSLALPFGGVRQYSTIAKSNVRSLTAAEVVPDGSIFYKIPIHSFGYSRVLMPDGSVLVIDTS